MKPRAALRCAWVALAAPGLLAGCWDVGFESSDEPGPPPTAFVWIDQADSKVDTASVQLQGEAECDGCPPATGWLYMECPAIQCPDTRADVYWTNETAGTTGTTTHFITPACHCPPFSYNYCYSACNHVWWTWVPLVYGANDVRLHASAPGLATGTDSAQIERVPPAPAWLAAQPGAGQVTLGWSAVGDATSYNLYWSTTPYRWSSLCEKIANVTSPYTHTGLASGLTHYYYVTGLVGEAESFDSPMLAATPD